MNDNERLKSHLHNLRGKYWKNDTALFLAVLGFVHSEHQDIFSRIQAIKGTKRVYFAERKEDIEASGVSTMPERVPGTNMWVYTNDNTERKKKLCNDVLQLFRYSMAARIVVKEEFKFIQGNKDSFKDLL